MLNSILCRAADLEMTWPRIGGLLRFQWKRRLNFFPPIPEHVCPLFVQIAQMGLILPRWGLIWSRIPPPTPVLYSAVIHTFRGYVHTQSTHNPSQNTPLPCLNLKVGKMKYRLGNLDPSWAKCLKSGQKFLEVGKEK